MEKCLTNHQHLDARIGDPFDHQCPIVDRCSDNSVSVSRIRNRLQPRCCAIDLVQKLIVGRVVPNKLLLNLAESRIRIT